MASLWKSSFFKAFLEFQIGSLESEKIIMEQDWEKPGFLKKQPTCFFVFFEKNIFFVFFNKPIIGF